MNKKIIDKMTSLSITLALTAGLTLPACGKKSNDYVQMDEVFYDQNVEGIDDTFEQKISDSSFQISNIIKLEEFINELKKLREIDFNKVSIQNLSIRQADVENIDIEEIETRYKKYEQLKEEKISETDYGKQEQLYNITKQLYEDYIKLNSYINYYGNKTIYSFGKNLYKAIILDVGNFNGNETNVTALINIYRGSSEMEGNSAYYESDDGYEVSIDIDKKSKLYSVIGKVSEYADSQEQKEFHIILEYDENKIKELEDTLNLYKECIYTEYRIDDKMFIIIPTKSKIKSGKTEVPKTYIKAK